MSDGSHKNAVGLHVTCTTMASNLSVSDVSVLAMDPQVIGLHSDSRITIISDVQTTSQCSSTDAPINCPASSPCNLVETASIAVVNNSCWKAASDVGSCIAENDNIVISSTGTHCNTFRDRVGQIDSDSCQDNAISDIVSERSNLNSSPKSQSPNLFDIGDQIASSNSSSAFICDGAAVNSGPGGASSSDNFSSAPMSNDSTSSQIQAGVGSSNCSSLNEARCLSATLQDGDTLGISKMNSGNNDSNVDKAESGESHVVLNKTSKVFDGKNLLNSAAADIKLVSGQDSEEDVNISENRGVHDAGDPLNQFATDFSIGDEFSLIHPDDELNVSCDVLPSFRNQSEVGIANSSLNTSHIPSSVSSFSMEDANQDCMAQTEDQCSNSRFSDHSSMATDDVLSSADDKFAHVTVFSDPKLNFKVFVKIDKLKLPLVNVLPDSKDRTISPRETDLCYISDHTCESVEPSCLSQQFDPVETKSHQLLVSFDESDSNPPSPDYLKHFDLLCANKEDCNLQETSSQLNETLAQVDRCSTPDQELLRLKEGTSESVASLPAAAVCSDSKALEMACCGDNHHEPGNEAGLVVAGSPTVSPALREMSVEEYVPSSHLEHQANEPMSAVKSWHQYLNDDRYQPSVKLVRLPLEFFQIVMASREAKMDQIQHRREKNAFDITQYTARDKGKHADRFEKSMEKSKNRTSHKKSKKRILLDSDSDSEASLPSKRSKSVERSSESVEKKDSKDNSVWKLDRLKGSLKISPDKLNKVVTNISLAPAADIATKNSTKDIRKSGPNSSTNSDRDAERVKSKKEKVKDGAVNSKTIKEENNEQSEPSHIMKEPMKSDESVELVKKKKLDETTSSQDKNNQMDKTGVGSKEFKIPVKTEPESKINKLTTSSSAKSDIKKSVSHTADDERKKNAKDHKSGGFVIPKVAKRSDVKVESSSESPLSALDSRRKVVEEQKRKPVFPNSVGDQRKHAKSVPTRLDNAHKPPQVSTAADGLNRLQKYSVKCPVKTCDSSSLSVLDRIEKHPGYIGKPEQRSSAVQSGSNKVSAGAKSSTPEQLSPYTTGAPIPTLSGRRDLNARQNKSFNQSNVAVGGPVSNILAVGSDRIPDMDERYLKAGSTNGVFIPDQRLSDSSTSFSSLGTPLGYMGNATSESCTATGSRYNTFAASDQNMSLSFDDSPELSDTSSPHLTYRTPAPGVIPAGSSTPFSSMKINNCPTNYLPPTGFPPVPLVGPPPGYPNMLGMPPPPIGVLPSGFPNMFSAMSLPPPAMIVPAEGYSKTNPLPVMPPAVVQGNAYQSSGILHPQPPQTTQHSSVCPPPVSQMTPADPLSEDSGPQSRKAPLLPTPVNPPHSPIAGRHTSPAIPTVSAQPLLPLPDGHQQEISHQQGAGVLDAITPRPPLLGRAPALLGDRPSLLGSGPSSSTVTRPASGSAISTSELTKVPKTSLMSQDSLLRGLGDLLSQFGELQHLPDDDHELELENYIGWLSEACLKIAEGRPLSPRFHERLQKLMDNLSQSLDESDEQPLQNCGRSMEMTVSRQFDSKPPIPSLMDLDLRNGHQHKGNESIDNSTKTRPLAAVVGDRRVNQVAGENLELLHLPRPLGDLTKQEGHQDVRPVHIGEGQSLMPGDSQMSFTEQLMEVFVASGCSRESARNLITTAQTIAEGQLPNNLSHGNLMLTSPPMNFRSVETAATSVEHLRRINENAEFQGSGINSIGPMEPRHGFISSSRRDSMDKTYHHTDHTFRPMDGTQFMQSSEAMQMEVSPFMVSRGLQPWEEGANRMNSMDRSNRGERSDHSRRSCSIDRERLARSVPLTASEILAKKIHDELQLCDVLVKIQSELAGIYDLTTDDSASPSDKESNDFFLPENLSMSFMGKNVAFPLVPTSGAVGSMDKKTSKMSIVDSFVSAHSASPDAEVRSSRESRTNVAEQPTSSGHVNRRSSHAKDSTTMSSNRPVVLPVSLSSHSPKSVPSGPGANILSKSVSSDLKANPASKTMTSPHTPVVSMVNQALNEPYSPSQNSDFGSPVSQISGHTSSLGSVNAAKVTQGDSTRSTAEETGKKPVSSESSSTKKDSVALDKKSAEDIIISMSRAALKPHYHSGRITPQEYKEIMKKAISKIGAKTNGDVSEKRVVKFINAYVEKVIMDRKT